MPPFVIDFTRYELGRSPYYIIKQSGAPASCGQLKRIFDRTKSALAPYKQYVKGIHLWSDRVEVELRPDSPFEEMANAIKAEFFGAPKKSNEAARSKEATQTTRRRRTPQPNHVAQAFRAT